MLLLNWRKRNIAAYLGINIGKKTKIRLWKMRSMITWTGFRRLAIHADYITINISSPNTAQLRELHKHDPLTQLLSTLKKEQTNFFETNKKICSFGS